MQLQASIRGNLCNAAMKHHTEKHAHQGTRKVHISVPGMQSCRSCNARPAVEEPAYINTLPAQSQPIKTVATPPGRYCYFRSLNSASMTSPCTAAPAFCLLLLGASESSSTTLSPSGMRTCTQTSDQKQAIKIKGA
jgi:hypothetical protein